MERWGSRESTCWRYGGHRAAAGVTIARDKVGDFAAHSTKSPLIATPDDLVPEIRVDLEVSIDGMDQKIESLFRHSSRSGIAIPHRSCSRETS